MTLKIEELRSFAAAAEMGSFSEAARKLRRAQSVVSMHIAGMEAELGYKLFERTPKPVLTPRGAELLAGAQRLVAEADRLQTRAAALSQTASPALYMGIDLALEAPVMIEWLRLFAKTFPSVRLQVENMTGSEADWFLAKAGMNLALVFSSKPALESDERVLGRTPLCIVTSKTHPLAALTHPTLDDLKRHRQIVVYARAPESSPPAVVSTDHWEVDSGLWALGLAAKGLGWTILPKFLLLGQSPYRNAVTAIESPMTLESERLVLRSRPGEVSPDILEWWTTTIGRYRQKLGLAD